VNNNRRQLTIIGMPLDLGASKLGVDIGPTAIRYAGILDACKTAGYQFTDLGDIDVMRNFSLDRYPLNQRKAIRLQEIARVSNKLASMVHSSCMERNIPIILGGDHATSIGSISGVAKAYDRIGLLWIDAHPDSNTPDTSLTGNVHGMTVAISLGYGYNDLVNCFGFYPKIRPQDVCMIGIKDMDAAEVQFLQEKGVSVYTMSVIQEIGIANVMKEAALKITRDTDTVYVSLDADVMDSQIAPGTGIASKGGLNYREITYLTEFIGNNLPVAALDVIEVNPLLDLKNTTAELCVELVMSLLGTKYSDYEKKYLRENVLQADVKDT
jgi:arginase